MLLQLHAHFGTAWLDLQELRSTWETVTLRHSLFKQPLTKSRMTPKYPKQHSNCPKHKDMLASESPAEIMVYPPHFG